MIVLDKYVPDAIAFCGILNQAAAQAADAKVTFLFLSIHCLNPNNYIYYTINYSLRKKILN